MTFGERLIGLRKENGFNTRDAFAEKLGVPETTLRNYETNAREPCYAFLKQISELFNISVDYLLCLTDNKEVSGNSCLCSSEQNIIEKYRFISAYSPDGASVVDTVLDREYSIAKKLEVQSKQIQKMDMKVSKEFTPTRIIAFYQRLTSAGNVDYLSDNIPTDFIEIEETEISRKADFVIGVGDKSMEPDYMDGEKVFVQKVTSIPTGEVGIFINENDCFIKELGKDCLVSRNKDYPDIIPTHGTRLIGKVIGKV